ncbi:MAG: DUF3826 domain-containing protein, partial [Planctomycetaceae bacterium]
DRLVKELALTEDKQKQVSQIFDTQKQAVENWQKENGDKLKDIQKQIADAKQAGDKDKLKDLQQQRAKLVESRVALHENLMKQLGDVLTPEQLAKAKTILGQAADKVVDVMGAIHQLNLSDDQKNKITEIMDKARADAEKATEPADKAKIMKDAIEQIRSTVLTDEQRKKLQGMLKDKGPDAGGEFPGIMKLDLTEDQKTKILAVTATAREDAAKADTPKAKRDIFQAARQKILSEVLTPEQKAKWDKNKPLADASVTKQAEKN